HLYLGRACSSTLFPEIERGGVDPERFPCRSHEFGVRVRVRLEHVTRCVAIDSSTVVGKRGRKAVLVHHGGPKLLISERPNSGGPYERASNVHGSEIRRLIENFRNRDGIL